MTPGFARFRPPSLAPVHLYSQLVLLPLSMRFVGHIKATNDRVA